MTDDRFPSLLAEFGASLGLDGLCLDQDQNCTLLLDQALLTLHWREEAEALLVYAPVGGLRDAADPLALCRQLLEANCLGLGTGGLTLGVQPGLEAIILSGQVVTRQLTLDALSGYIRFFADQTEHWMRTLREGAPARPDLAADTPAGPMLRV